MKLPKKLIKEPIVDSVFEVRFSSLIPASSVLPGVLFSKLPGNKNIEKLPAAQLPEQVRASDPNLQFAPVTRVISGDFVYLFSDRSIAVACKKPYPGWTAFKSAILQAIEHIEAAGIISSVQRYSLRYVDMIPPDGAGNKSSLVMLDLKVGKHILGQEPFQVRVEIPKGSVVNAVSIISNAMVKFPDGSTKEGLVIDIDSITNVGNIQLAQLLQTLRNDLDNIHDANAELFFECLKPETIASLGPVYE